MVEITVKREELGRVSRYLHDRAREGDLWQVTAAAGRFTFTGEEADRVALLAGGGRYHAAHVDDVLPLLELVEALDVGIDSECHAGICGRCKCQMLSGSVQMETQEALSQTDRRNHIILMCEARALDNVTMNA